MKRFTFFALALVVSLLSGCLANGSIDQHDATTNPTALTFDAQALSQEECVALELTLQNQQSWYPRFLCAASFAALDDPAADLKLYSVFANGAPGDSISTLTEEERQLLNTKYGDSASRDTYRLSRQTVVDAMVSCLGVTGEQAFSMAQEEPGLHYLERTDCFYTTEMYNVVKADICEAWRLEDGTIRVHYRDLLTAGENQPATHTAILQPKDEGCVILSNMPIDPGETTIPTEPDFSMAATAPVSVPTEPTVPQPAEPEPAEPQDTRLQREGDPLGVEEIADLMQLLTDSHSWYPTILKFPFDSPAEINCYNLFCNGVPGADPFEPTEEERAYLTGLHGEDYFRLEVDCIDRSVMHQVLRTHFGLTDAEISALSVEGLTYMEETDRYYSDQNSSNKIALLITEAYALPDGTVAVYFYNYSQYLVDGAEWAEQFRAVFRWEEDQCVFESNELIYNPYAP